MEDQVSNHLDRTPTRAPRDKKNCVSLAPFGTARPYIYANEKEKASNNFDILHTP